MVALVVFGNQETIMRKQRKYKQTLLSSLFIEVFFLMVGKTLAPVPVLQSLFNIVASEL